MPSFPTNLQEVLQNAGIEDLTAVQGNPFKGKGVEGLGLRFNKNHQIHFRQDLTLWSPKLDIQDIHPSIYLRNPIYTHPNTIISNPASTFQISVPEADESCRLPRVLCHFLSRYPPPKEPYKDLALLNGQSYISPIYLLQPPLESSKFYITHIYIFPT